MNKDEPSIDLLNIVDEWKEKLRRSGIMYLRDILICTITEIMKILGTDDETAMQIVENASRLLEELMPEEYGTLKLKDLQELDKKRMFLHTGSKNLDNILRGGWASRELTELAGEYGTGKTQTCYTAIATAFLPPEEGGLNTGDISVAVIDSENVFSYRRLEPILRRFDINLKKIKDKLMIMKPKHTAEQLQTLRGLLPEIRKRNIKLIIVDSLTKYPRTDFSGRQLLYTRQRAIISMVERLRRYAINFNIVTLITNQVVGVPNQGKRDNLRPVGGHILGHNVDTRLLLTSIKEDIKQVKIIDSSWLPPQKTKIRITEAGIMDPE